MPLRALRDCPAEIINGESNSRNNSAHRIVQRRSFRPPPSDSIHDDTDPSSEFGGGHRAPFRGVEDPRATSTVMEVVTRYPYFRELRCCGCSSVRRYYRFYVFIDAN